VEIIEHETEVEARETAGDAARSVVIRLWSWDKTGGGPYGPELIARGATQLPDNGAPVVLTRGHGDTIVGVLTNFEERVDGAYGTFDFEDTNDGADAYKLAKKGTHRFVSPAFEAIHDRVMRVGATAVKVYDKIVLRAVGLTWKPAYATAQIMEVREQDLVSENTAPETPAQPAPVVTDTQSGLDRMAADLSATLKSAITPLSDKISALEDAARKGFSLPSEGDAKADSRSVVALWLPNAVRYLAGEKIATVEMRALADITTTGNLGVVPEGARADIADAIDPARPFMESTTKVNEPEGMKLVYPRLTTRPIVGIQPAEKAELASGPVSVTAEDYAALTIGGAADISIQLIRKSSPSFLELFLRLLAEAYAAAAEEQALDALVASGPSAGTGTFDPAAPSYGETFSNGLAAGPGLTPDRIWLAPDAAAAFIDARTAVTWWPDSD
jgi:phage head maturation protease